MVLLLGARGGALPGLSPRAVLKCPAKAPGHKVPGPSSWHRLPSNPACLPADPVGSGPVQVTQLDDRTVLVLMDSECGERGAGTLFFGGLPAGCRGGSRCVSPQESCLAWPASRGFCFPGTLRWVSLQGEQLRGPPEVAFDVAVESAGRLSLPLSLPGSRSEDPEGLSGEVQAGG